MIRCITILFLSVKTYLFMNSMACSPTRDNRCRSGRIRTLKCSKYDYSCNIADLTEDGEVLDGKKVRTLSGSCKVTVRPDYYGAGIAVCELRTSGLVTYTLEKSVSSDGKVTFTESASTSSSLKIRYRSNCSAWCGQEKETNCVSRNCTDHGKWNLNTYQRCYGGSTCSASKCLKRKPSTCLESEVWYDKSSGSTLC